MAQSWNDPTARICYIRTVGSDPEADNKVREEDGRGPQAFVPDCLETWVYQDKPKQVAGGKQKPVAPRQHYILGIDTAIDRLAIDWLLEASKEGEDDPKIARRDFTVFVLREKPKGPEHEELLQRLKAENVEVEALKERDLAASQAEYPSSEACDAFMLTKSNYVVNHINMDFIDQYRYYNGEWKDSMRLGAPEAIYDDRHFFWYDRLQRKTGHTKRGCCWEGKCLYWRREHLQKWYDYACPSCGGRCKRSKGCQKTGEYWVEDTRPEWLRDAEEENGPVPPEFAREWRTMSARETVEKYNLRSGIGPAEGWRWRSIDTFSGDVSD
ncbi:hypothetical protein ACHAQA_005822 [Verticillium albo-atrum]